MLTIRYENGIKCSVVKEEILLEGKMNILFWASVSVISIWGIISAALATGGFVLMKISGMEKGIDVISELETCVIQKKCPFVDSRIHRVMDKCQWYFIKLFSLGQPHWKVAVISQWLRWFFTVFIFYPLIEEIFQDVKERMYKWADGKLHKFFDIA